MAVAGVESAAGVGVFVIFAALFIEMAGGGLYEKIRSMKKISTLSLSVLLVLLTVVWQTLSAQTVLFHEEFEGGVLPAGWTVVDADGDGYNWDASYLYQNAGSSHSGDGMIASASWYSLPLTPDNWLISPAINLTVNSFLTFWVRAQDVNWPEEHYGVYISTTGGASISDFTLLYEETLNAESNVWSQKSVDLSNYSGQTIRIAFRHFN